MKKVQSGVQLYPERSKEIVRLYTVEKLTLQKIGDHYDLSRERIRQILNREGIVIAKVREKKIKEKKKLFAKLLEEKKKEVKFLCRACGTPVTYGEKNRHYWLCRKCWSIVEFEQRNPYVWNTCNYCSKKYHPYRNYQYMSIKTFFCSFSCYNRFRRQKVIERLFNSAIKKSPQRQSNL